MPDGNKRKQRNDSVKGKAARAKEVDKVLSSLGGSKTRSERMAAVKAKKAKERAALNKALNSYSKKVGR